MKEFGLRSSYGGTMEPFYLYLFKGGLLWETLLKLSPDWKGKKETAVLGEIFNDNRAAIRNKLGISDLFVATSKKAFEEIVEINRMWRKNGLAPLIDTPGPHTA